MFVFTYQIVWLQTSVSRLHTSLHWRPGNIISFFFRCNQLLGYPPYQPPRSLGYPVYYPKKITWLPLILPPRSFPNQTLWLASHLCYPLHHFQPNILLGVKVYIISGQRHQKVHVYWWPRMGPIECLVVNMSSFIGFWSSSFYDHSMYCNLRGNW